MVVTMACETPCARTTGLAPAETSAAMPPNAWNMPSTVPSRPTIGAIAAMSASQSTAMYARSAMRWPVAAGSYDFWMRSSASLMKPPLRCAIHR